MPKREDESWVSKKSDLRYCSRHKRYYDVKVGCQLCYLDELNLKKEVEEIPQLQQCPECKQKSLFWNKDYRLYECLNRDCKKRFAEGEIVEKEKKPVRSEKASNQEANEDVPKKELKEEGERGLCPFCGSSDVYEIVRDSWRCKRCEKTFPSPSYGPGEGFGKEARWFRKTTAEFKREVAREEQVSSSGGGKAWFGNEYFDSKSGRWKKPRGSFSMRKFFLALLVVACLVAAAYTGYLLTTGQTDPIVGAIILAVDIGVLVWNISVFRSYRVRFGSILAIFMVTALVASSICAFAGIAPFSDAKERITEFFNPEPAVAAPISFSIIPGESQNKLRWTIAEETDLVLIRCSTTGFPNDVTEGAEIYVGSESSYTHTGLTNGVEYHYSIWSGKNVDGEKRYSEDRLSAVATPQWIPPSTPTNFMVDARHEQNYLTWTLADMNHHTLVRFSTTGYPVSPTDGIQAYLGAGTDYLHSDLENGTAYYYSIWAVRDVDEGPLYSEESAHTSGTPHWLGPAGERIHEYVYCSIYQIVGPDGEAIELFNNPEAKNPTWEELKQFLWEDGTDKVIYNEDSFVCANFAEMLHNNAEKAGIRAAFVSLALKQEYPWGTVFPLGSNHSLNAFDTTDRGLVYIDSTGTRSGNLDADKIVEVSIGDEYIAVSIFPNPGYEDQWGSSLYREIVYDHYFCIQW